MRSMIIAQFLWSAGLTLVGFVAADSFVYFSHQIEHFGWIFGASVGLLFMGRIWYRWRKTQQLEDIGPL